jgi:hypothetical protein
VVKTEFVDKQRFDELVVWYVNGSLDADDRRWVEDYLQAHPASRHELAWHNQLKNANDIQDIKVPPNVGLEKLLKQVNAERVVPQLSVMQRITQFFATLSARPAYALTALVVLAQSVGLGVLVKEVNDRDRVISDFSQIRAIPTQPVTANAPTLDVTFKSSATEQDIRLLLVGIQANIVAGPRQLGDYTVAVRSEAIEEARTTLQKSPIVEFVSPQRPGDGGEK